MPSPRRKPTASSPPGQAAGSEKNPHATRETVESIVVAVILAFLFRAFVAEAFVIPTGSMAPTLQGRHMDVRCPQCEHSYRTGASSENRDNSNIREVKQTTCPICRYTMDLQKSSKPNHNSFNGDRILVSKFAYLLGAPERWDVIVFKYPGNAKQNYIKRLIGLPGESVRIRHGDISVRTASEAPYTIARKPPAKVKAMRLVGEVQGRDCIMVDDMIDTGATLTEAADLLVTSGAKSVRAVATHPVLSGTSVERINRSKIDELIVTDTIPLPAEKQIDKITVVSVAPLLAAALRNIHVGKSVSGLA